MSNYLVVAHKTLLDEHVLQEVAARAAGGAAAFHLLVPMAVPPMHNWTEGEVQAATRRRLSEGLEALRAIGVHATGEIGDGHPVLAVQDVLRRGNVPVDAVILSTLPPGLSRWVKLDVPHRMAEAIAPIPVHHVVAARAPAGV